MKSLFNFIKSKSFFINLGAVLLVIALTLGFTYKWLDSYTNHGETITVPDCRGQKVSGLDDFLSSKNLRFKISDSSFYDLKKGPGVVIEQDPKPNEKVKENRTIYVSITRSKAPLVKMPNLIDASSRQAEALLASFGLKLGETKFVPDLAKNAVLEQAVDGRNIKPGELIPQGTVIDLVVGDGYGNTKVEVPQLYGLSLSEAVFVLKGSSLNVGAIVCDATVKDSLQAMVYKQNPPADTSAISQGEAIDLFVTQSSSVLKSYKPGK